MNNKLYKKILKLEEEMNQVEKTKYHSNNQEYIDNQAFIKWKMKTRNLITKLEGENSEYYKGFIQGEKASLASTNFTSFKKLEPIFLALKEDFEDEYGKFDADTETIQGLEELSNLNKELKELLKVEDITETQKIIIKQICYEIDEAIDEHVITGNTAVQKLYESLVGKLVLYQEELKNIDSDKVKDTLSKVYKKIEGLHKAMNTLISIGNKAKDIFDLLPF